MVDPILQLLWSGIMTKSRGIRRAPRRRWRAIAYVPDPTAPNGRRRTVAGRAAAATPDGLTAWINRQRRAGNVVDTYTVASLDELLP